ncbi:hypothetical protein D3C76_1593760 [compost metagenome]
MLFAEFREACGTEEGTATVDHVRYTVAIQLNHAVFVQTQVTVIHAKNFQTFGQRCTNHSTNGGVHAWRITAAC